MIVQSLQLPACLPVDPSRVCLSTFFCNLCFKDSNLSDTTIALSLHHAQVVLIRDLLEEAKAIQNSFGEGLGCG
jgi:hypothetical protein